MQRITEKDLQNIATRINRAAGTPLTYSDKREDGKFTANIGNYHLDFAYGGVCMVQTMNEGGGIRNVTTGGYCTKRELYHQMQSYLAGLEECIRSQQEHDSKVNAAIA
jgi:2,4-dienoyl-CoA reductase-like NADH-dependent reductase (Old Yellow Enzyme family)